MSDTRATIRKDALMLRLRAILREARALNASAPETLSVLMDMCARIYAVELAGTVTTKEKRRAKAAFLRGAEAMLNDLPTAQMDELVERKLALLRGKDHDDGRTRKPG